MAGAWALCRSDDFFSNSSNLPWANSHVSRYVSTHLFQRPLEKIRNKTLQTAFPVHMFCPPGTGSFRRAAVGTPEMFSRYQILKIFVLDTVNLEYFHSNTKLLETICVILCQFLAFLPFNSVNHRCGIESLTVWYDTAYENLETWLIVCGTPRGLTAMTADHVEPIHIASISELSVTITDCTIFTCVISAFVVRYTCRRRISVSTLIK